MSPLRSQLSSKWTETKIVFHTKCFEIEVSLPAMFQTIWNVGHLSPAGGKILAIKIIKNKQTISRVAFHVKNYDIECAIVHLDHKFLETKFVKQKMDKKKSLSILNRNSTDAWLFHKQLCFSLNEVLYFCEGQGCRYFIGLLMTDSCYRRFFHFLPLYLQQRTKFGKAQTSSQ